MDTGIYYGIIYGVIVISVIVIGLMFRYVFKQSKGSKEMQEISNAIRDGAMAFLKRQYKTIAMISAGALIIIVAAVYFGNRGKPDVDPVLCRMARRYCLCRRGVSALDLPDILGMFMSVNSNIRSAEGARTSLDKALQIAFRGGSVTGLAVTTLFSSGCGNPVSCVRRRYEGARADYWFRFWRVTCCAVRAAGRRHLYEGR